MFYDKLSRQLHKRLDQHNLTEIEHICQFLYKFVHFIITKAIFGSVGNLAPDFFFVFFGVFNKTTQ